MATWILPVVVGITHEGKPVEISIGTFPDESSANAWGPTLKAGKKARLVHPAQQLMTLKEYDAYLAGVKAQNAGPESSVRAVGEDEL